MVCFTDFVLWKLKLLKFSVLIENSKNIEIKKGIKRLKYHNSYKQLIFYQNILVSSYFLPKICCLNFCQNCLFSISFVKVAVGSIFQRYYIALHVHPFRQEETIPEKIIPKIDSLKKLCPKS